MVPFYLMNSIRAYLLCAAVRDDQKGIQKKMKFSEKSQTLFAKIFNQTQAEENCEVVSTHNAIFNSENNSNANPMCRNYI